MSPHLLPTDLRCDPFPERWPADYRHRARVLGPGNPLLQSGTAHPSELLPDPESRADPTGECAVSPLPFLVRKHRDRVLVLIAARCFLHCRFCFRRGQPERFRTAPDTAAWHDILSWLGAHPEVEEVILSGGDPLTLPDRRLGEISADLTALPHLRRWRIHTRAPVVAPQRVTPELARAVAGGLPLRVVYHANHPAELGSGVDRATRRLQEAGVALANQGVLLCGVNDDPQVLLELFGRLGKTGVLPHYLHHPDRAPGNARFRVPLRRGLAIHQALVGLAEQRGQARWVPPYVVDLPSGAGKCPVAALRPVCGERHGDRVRTRFRWVPPEDWDGAAGSCEWWDVWEATGNGAWVQDAAADPCASPITDGAATA
ncbi:MAG TPA: radical SAM protein [Deferrisomatales bacterium]|nr:radical SAM protein [Deferrisomatales bacterium]